LGLAKTGGIASNGSGDYVIAVSTAESVRVPYGGNTVIAMKFLKVLTILLKLLNILKK